MRVIFPDYSGDAFSLADQTLFSIVNQMFTIFFFVDIFSLTFRFFRLFTPF